MRLDFLVSVDNDLQSPEEKTAFITCGIYEKHQVHIKEEIFMDYPVGSVSIDRENLL